MLCYALGYGPVMAGLVPAIHVFDCTKSLKTWMPGNKLALGPAEGRTRVAGHDVVGVGATA